MPGQNRYGYGASQADRLEKEFVEPFAPVQEGAGDTTEADVIKDIIDGAAAAANVLSGGETFATVTAGYLFSEDKLITPEAYPSAAQLITRYATLAYHLVTLLNTIGTSFSSKTCNGRTPNTIPIDMSGGDLDDIIAAAEEDVLYFPDLLGSGHTPYVSNISDTQWNYMIDAWGAGLSAHPSGSPFEVVTPANSLNWSYSPANSYPDFLEWMEDLQAGSGSGAIYVSDV
jgi:hypothetical protein